MNTFGLPSAPPSRSSKTTEGERNRLRARRSAYRVRVGDGNEPSARRAGRFRGVGWMGSWSVSTARFTSSRLFCLPTALKIRQQAIVRRRITRKNFTYKQQPAGGYEPSLTKGLLPCGVIPGVKLPIWSRSFAKEGGQCLSSGRHITIGVHAVSEPYADMNTLRNSSS